MNPIAPPRRTFPPTHALADADVRQPSGAWTKPLWMTMRSACQPRTHRCPMGPGALHRRCGSGGAPRSSGGSGHTADRRWCPREPARGGSPRLGSTTRLPTPRPCRRATGHHRGCSPATDPQQGHDCPCGTVAHDCPCGTVALMQCLTSGERVKDLARLPLDELWGLLEEPPVVAVPVLAVIQADGPPRLNSVRAADPRRGLRPFPAG